VLGDPVEDPVRITVVKDISEFLVVVIELDDEVPGIRVCVSDVNSDFEETANVILLILSK